MREDDDLLENLKRRAIEDAAAEVPWEEQDLLAALRDPAPLSAADIPPDLTLGGYIARHDRPPAFQGADGQPYTVAVDVEQDPGTGSFAAFFIFIRWAETGAGIMGHVESGDVAAGQTADQAQAAALELSLYDVKTELDAAIERRRRDLED
jgi:hypothetical protein